MENRAENALRRIAAVRPCPNCDSTGTTTRSDGRVHYCSVCEGRKEIPALNNREAQRLAYETLATIERHKEATETEQAIREIRNLREELEARSRMLRQDGDN